MLTGLVEVGISPETRWKESLGLEKDPKLKYKARHYKAKKYTAEQRTVSYWGRKKYGGIITLILLNLKRLSNTITSQCS